MEQGTGQMPLLSLSSASTAPLTPAMTSAMLPTADTLLEQSAYFLPKSLQDVGPSVTGEDRVAFFQNLLILVWACCAVQAKIT